MAGLALDEDDFKALEKRDDTTRTLWEMLREENMKMSDLLRLKRQVCARCNALLRSSIQKPVYSL